MNLIKRAILFLWVLMFLLSACQRGETTPSASQPAATDETTESMPPRLSVGAPSAKYEEVTTGPYTSYAHYAYSFDGNLWAAADFEGLMIIWVWMDFSQYYWFENFIIDLEPLTSLAVSHDGKRLAAGFDDTTILVWDTQGLLLEDLDVTDPVLLEEFNAPSTIGLAFSHNSEVLVALSKGQLTAWDWVAGERLNSAEGAFTVLATSPLEPLFAVGHPDGSVGLWMIGEVEQERTLDAHQGAVRSLVFSPSGKILASGGEDHAIHLWDASDGSLVRTLVGHEAPVRHVIYHPDGAVLASLGDDGIRFWHPPTGTLMHTQAMPAGDIRLLAFTPKEPLMSMLSDDGSLVMLEVEVVDPAAPTPDLEGTNVAGVKTEDALFAAETLEAEHTATPVTTPRPTNTPPQQFDEFVDGFGVPMIRIPAGIVSLGGVPAVSLDICQVFREECQPEWFLDEAPIHSVELGEYWIDQFEVTNARYAACVEAGECDPPELSSSATRASYYGNPAYDDFPVIFVSWEDAINYCSWRGGRLPSEAEWETAARGGLEGSMFPWGTELPECAFASFSGAKFDDGALCDDTDTEAVGSYYPNAYGIHDMAGNVLEWTADWYNVYPGGDPDISSEFGDVYRVARGGSWFTFGDALRVAIRFPTIPSASFDHYGFRCVLSE